VLQKLQALYEKKLVSILVRTTKDIEEKHKMATEANTGGSGSTDEFVVDKHTPWPATRIHL
jgi:hypothetical protein